MSHAIRTQGLTKVFGAYTAVDHIDIAVQAGEVKSNAPVLTLPVSR
jgi:ABC-type uncharacterized transport system ATPase subunit